MAKLYFHYAAMNAGKSTVLLQAAFNYRERGMRTMLFTAEIDQRFGVGRIASRIGLEEKAHVFNAETDLFEAIGTAGASIDAVFVDEAQFLTRRQVFDLARVADDLNVPVLCYGLRTDFQANLFEGSQWLLALADDLKELKTICHCGRKATMNLRFGADGEPVRDGASVEIGGEERYVALCRKHFMERIGDG